VGKAVKTRLTKETGIIVNVFTHFFVTTRQLEHRNMDSYRVLLVFGEFSLRNSAPVGRQNFKLRPERITLQTLHYKQTNTHEHTHTLTDMRRLTTGIRSEKFVFRRFRRCTNVIEVR